MRKLTLLIVTLLCYVGVLHAQALVADGVYTLSADVNKQRGEMVAAADYNYPVLDGIDLGGYTGNSTAAMTNGEYWHVQCVDASSNTYYIYNIAKGKYLVNEDGNVNFGDSPYVWTFVTHTSGYLNIKDASKTDNKVWLSSGCGRKADARPVQWDSNNNDGGALYTFTFVSDYFATPVAGKFYKIKGDGELPWLTANATNGGNVVVSGEEASAGVFLKTQNGIQAVATGKYLGYAGGKYTYSDAELNIELRNTGDYLANYNNRYAVVSGGNYMFNNNNDGIVHESNQQLQLPRLWAFIEVEAPAATVDGMLYPTLEAAAEAVQPGQTLTLWKDSDETFALPIGVTLNKNGHTADNVTVATPVAEVGGVEYATLAAAIKAASAGATITFVADINESDTLSKNLTIDGAGFNYTGVMTAAKSKTITVKNVNFVKGRVLKEKEASKGTYTFQNCTFDGEGTSYYYALEIKGAATLKVENCTAKNYVYSFLYFSHAVTNVNINNVVAENVPNYGVYFASGVTTAKFENFTVKHSNNGILVNNEAAKSLTLKDCAMVNVTTAINHAKGTKSITCTLDGVNDFGGAALSEYVKFAKAVKVGTKFYPTLAAAVEVAAQGETIVLMSNTDEAVMIPKGVKLEYNGFAAENVTFEFVAVATIGDVEYDSFDAAYTAAKKGDVIVLKKTAVITNSKPWVNYSKKNITVEANFGETAFRIQDGAYVWLGGMTINSNDYCVIVGSQDGSTGANVEIYGGTYNGSTSAISVTKGDVKIIDGTFKVEPYEGSYAYTINCVDANYKNGTAAVEIQGGKFYNFNPGNNAAEGAGTRFLISGKSAVQGEDGYYKVVNAEAKINDVHYLTLEEAIAAAGDGDVVELCNNVEVEEIVVIDKAITLNGWGRSLTSTAARAINIETEGEVVIKGLTVNAGERAFNIINKPATVELNGVTAVANNNAVMIATSAGAANVTIDGCDFTGLAVVNVAGAKSNVAIKNSTITNVDNNPDENYGAITVWTSAEEAVVNVENTEITVADDSKKVYVFPANATVNGVDEDEVGRIIVTVGDAGFDTLAEAIDYANGETITFVMDAKGPGVVINKNAVIDFNGKTYSFTEGVGSTGTPSNGFQILKGNTVTLKNGTLNVDAEAADKFYILVQNYANLTVENMTLDGTNLDKWSKTDGDSYVLSNNCGTVNVIGSTIKANDEGALAFAMDACLKASYEAPVVTVAEGSTINGNVEVSATLYMNGTVDGAIIINAETGVVNGAEGLNVITNVADHKVVNNNGAYTVAAKHYVAKVGEAKYETFAAAVAAAPAGGTVKLIDNATEDAVVTLTKNLTIDGAGHTFTGAIEFKKSNGSFTVKNVNFNGPANSDRVYALKSQSSTTNLTVEGCTATGYPYGFLYANSAIANVTVTDVTVKNVTYGVHSARGTNVTLNNFVAENVKYGVMVQNYSGRNVVLNNCSFTGSENPLSIWERNQTYKITFNFKGANEMGKTDFCTSEMAVLNADAMVGTKVCETLAAAVEAANAGETVALMRDVQPESYVTIDKSITLNLGEYNITREGTALYVNGDVEVAINGTGTVTGNQALWVANGLAKVYGGNFHGLAEAVYVTNTGKAEIHNGTFSSREHDSFVLNKKDDSRETSDITVYGGTFTGFNPADNAAEGEGTNFVAEGYVVVDNGDGTYTVKENPAYGKVAKVGEEYYATLTEALAAAAAGTTVELIADVKEDVTLTKNVTINGANFKYTGTMSANANITVNVLDLNFVNAGFSKGTKSSNGNYTFNGCTFDGQGSYSRAIYVRGANKVVLENCTATGYDYFMYVPNALNNSITVKDVTVENCSGYAVMFNSGAGKATFENFKVKNSSTAIIYNNTANRALTLNNCTMEDVGTAIRHTGEGDKNITCTFVGKNNLGGAAFSEYVVLNNAALAGTTIYASLAEAVAAEGNEVKLLGNSTGAGVVIDEDLTIDFNGCTYTVNKAVGSKGTETLGLQIKKNHNVTLKNGTLKSTAVTEGKEVKMLVQNYANLTVENMNLVDATEHIQYVLSNNSGDNMITGATNITTDAVAFDSYKSNSYAAPTVTVETTGTIAGTIEKNEGAAIVIYSGTYTVDVNEWCAEGYAATKVADNLWTVIKAIAQVGEVKYASIQAAIDAAQDGDTVELLANVKLTDEDVIVIDNMKTFCHVAAGKNITFDMNGKEITVSYNGGNYLYGVFLVSGGMTVTGNGKIDIPQTDRQVAYMFLKRGTAGYLVIENGNFHAGNLEDSMIYTNGDEVVTVNGGTFFLDRTGERPNGCPWIFNTKGQNVNSIVVNGGTYNTNVSKQHYVHEAKLAEDKTMLDNGDGTWTVVEALAAIDGVGYRTLVEAVEAAAEGETVTLIKDVIGAGIVINKSITIDFNEKTYTVNKAVGSKGTETLGFQILKDNYVTLTNGTLTSTVAVEGSNEIKMLVQNYANLTLEDMNLVDETEHILYALSNNSGATFLTRNTNITTDAVAFDSYYSKYYDAPTVNVETTGTITGTIEKNDGATIAISSGTFTTEIYEEWCAEYHVPVQNADGTWTVESRYIDEVTIVDDDYTKFENKHEMTVGTLIYERTIPNAGVWQSMYVPFEIPVSMLKELGYDVAYFLDVHFEIADGVIDMSKSPDVHVIKINDGILKANFPYAIRANATANLNLKLELEDVVLSTSNEEDMNVVESSSTVNRFVFGGTYTRAIPSELTGDNNAICYAVSKKGEFKMMGENAGLPPFRVYMTIIAKDGAPVKYEGNPAESIAIRVIGEENEDGTTTIYDVNAEEAEEMIFDLSGRRVLETEKGIYIVNGKKVYVK